MNVVINGTVTAVDGVSSVTSLLASQKVKMPDMVSVELNGEILERSLFESTLLKEGDRVEFLYFMGGGSASRGGVR